MVCRSDEMASNNYLNDLSDNTDNASEHDDND